MILSVSLVQLYAGFSVEVIVSMSARLIYHQGGSLSKDGIFVLQVSMCGVKINIATAVQATLCQLHCLISVQM